MNFVLNIMCISDVDECGENLHGCTPDTETCRNTVGAYECDMKCDLGYQYSLGLRTCVGNVSHLKYIKQFFLSFYLGFVHSVISSDTNKKRMNVIFN